MNRKILFLTVVVSVFAVVCVARTSVQDLPILKFGSIPDIHLGDDIARQKAMEKSNNKRAYAIFPAMRAAGCTHVLLTGDWAGGHWEQDEWVARYGAEPRKRIYDICEIIHGNIRQMAVDSQLEPIVCPGDHEYGDNPWPTGSQRAHEFHYYREAFAKEFSIPAKYDGKIGSTPQRPLGTQYENTSFATIVKNVLFVSLDVFYFAGADTNVGRDGAVSNEFTQDQARWLDAVLEDGRKNPDVRFIVVQSHCPISMPFYINGGSSLNTIRQGPDSPLWKIMQKHGVDVYVAGEVHGTTVTEDPSSKLVEFVHGLKHFAIWEAYADRLVVKLYNNDAAQTQCGEMIIDKSSSGKHLTYDGDMRPIRDGEVLLHYSLDEKVSANPVRNLARLQSKQIFGVNEGAAVAEGIIGSASLRFNAADSLVMFSPNSIKEADNFSRTVCLWMRTSAMNGAIALTGPNLSSNLNIYLENGKLMAGARGKSYVVADEAIVNDDKWHFVAVSYVDDGNNAENLKLYVDGLPVHLDYSKYQGVKKSRTVKVTLGGCRIESTGNFNFYYKKSGQEVPRTITKSHLFSGWIDDFSLWYGVLTDREIQMLYQCGIDTVYRLNASQMCELFKAFRQKGTANVKNQLWKYSPDCPTKNSGRITMGKEMNFLTFDENGNGLIYRKNGVQK